MTPLEIHEACQALKKSVGPNAWVDFSIGQYCNREEPIQGTLYPVGVGGEIGRLTVRASDWGEAIEKLTALWEASSKRVNAATLRKLALTIIKVTSEFGSCRETDLRMEGFSQFEIELHGAAACEMANEMADLGPFTITALAGANAA